MSMIGKRVTKVKKAAGKLRVEYEVDENGGTNELSIASADMPRPEMERAFEACIPKALELCELPSGWPGVRVTGVSFSWTEDPNGRKIMGAVITMQKRLSGANCPLIINTPHLPSEPYSGQESDPNPVLDPKLVDALNVVAEEAMEYVKGNRAQGKLEGVP